MKCDESIDQIRKKYGEDSVMRASFLKQDDSPLLQEEKIRKNMEFEQATLSLL